MSKPPCYGIDLGTSCSSIGLVVDGVPRLFEIDGSPLLPSVVSFPEVGAPMIGTPALNQLPLAPERTVRSSKRHMGSDKTWPIGGREVSPVDVAALVLGRLLDAVERSRGERPRRAVITVPAWFTQAQRADTRRAGEAAGLTVERIINEPTAAMLAHAQGQDRERIALVYDLGGGTFDVSAVRQDGPVLEVLASHGDSRLGGDDIDQALTDGVMTRLSRDQPELREQLDASAAARVRLRAAVEEAKIALSQTLHATLRAPFLADGPDGPLHLELELSRGELEEAAGPWIARTLESVDQVLQDAGLAPEDIDELLLVGGATQTPMVWAALRDRYGLEGSHAIPPRTAVALGAAIQGAIVDGSRVHGVLVDVAPYSLSVGVSTGPGPNISTHFLCRVLTPRNTPLPSRHTEIFATHHPLQDGVKVPIFQGGHPDPYRNTLLGMVEIMGLEPAPPGHFNRPIAVEFRHNLDGIISATVTEELSGRRGEARLALDGEASEALMEELEELIGDLETGDGSDPEEEEDAPPEVSAPADLSADAEEARRTFQAALGSADALAVEGLEALIREGLAALDAGDEAAALERYDALSDKLFDEGIFL